MSLRLTLVLLLGLGLGRAGFAQSLGLEFVPSTTTMGLCLGEELVVEVRLTNPEAVDVGGYQLFLRFSAEYFEAVRYEAVAFNSFVEVAGPDPIGGGVAACSDGTLDPWADRRTEDVVSVVASPLGPGGADFFRQQDAVLGRFIFRTLREVTPPDGARFSPNLSVCHEPFDERTKVFGREGTALVVAEPASFSVSVEDTGPTVDAFTCTQLGDRMTLRWVAPTTTGVRGFRIYRDGEVLATLPTILINTWEDEAPPEGALLYEIAVLESDGSEGCRSACRVERSGGITFRRGDANRDCRVDVSDPVRILDHLFRDADIDCQDAADTNDSGDLNLTDPVLLLNFLFQPNSVAPALPFVNPGVDPTPDDLRCAA